MPDTDCEKACVEAYTAQVNNCTDVLRDNMILAKTEEETQLAKDRFARCMELAKEIKGICLGTCAEQSSWGTKPMQSANRQHQWP